jgi:signal recognition particle subunit SEC65
MSAGDWLDDWEEIQYLAAKERVRKGCTNRNWTGFAFTLKLLCEQRLYREEYVSFEAFCSAQLSHDFKWLLNLISCADIKNRASNAVPNSLQYGLCYFLPNHCLAIKHVPSDKLEDVLRLALVISAGNRISVEALRSSVESLGIDPPCEKSDSFPGELEISISKKMVVDGSKKTDISNVQAILNRIEDAEDLRKVADFCHARVARMEARSSVQ